MVIFYITKRLDVKTGSVCLSFLKGSIIKNQDLDCYGIFGEVGVCGDQSKVKNEQN